MATEKKVLPDKVWTNTWIEWIIRRWWLALAYIGFTNGSKSTRPAIWAEWLHKCVYTNSHKRPSRLPNCVFVSLYKTGIFHISYITNGIYILNIRNKNTTKQINGDKW